MVTTDPRQESDPKSEFIKKSWDRATVQVAVVLFGVILWLVAIVALVRSPGGRLDDGIDMTPEPEDIAYKIPEEMRSLLSSEVRDLLVRMESGQVSGHWEKEFRATLKQATQVENDGVFCRYHFALGKKKVEELDPIITVAVERRTGRIIRCSLWTCCS